MCYKCKTEKPKNNENNGKYPSLENTRGGLGGDPECFWMFPFWSQAIDQVTSEGTGCGRVEAESSLGPWCLHETGRVGWAGEKNEVAWLEYHFQLYWATALRGSTMDSLHQPGAFRLSAEVLAPNCASINMGHI